MNTPNHISIRFILRPSSLCKFFPLLGGGSCWVSFISSLPYFGTKCFVVVGGGGDDDGLHLIPDYAQLYVFCSYNTLLLSSQELLMEKMTMSQVCWNLILLSITIVTAHG